mmetsp:Transcript_10074/g.12770  ORF Transcript_10074/g.12770 Transcript_10074/m.12770 type:complete len:146 (+) Transcript_10074:124-561(+)
MPHGVTLQLFIFSRLINNRMNFFLHTTLFLSSASSVYSFAPTPGHLLRPTALFSKEIMSEMDIMCLSNAADLCSYYDECEIEEREALLNRFDEQTELMAERIASMNALVKHLTTGDHKHLEEEEVASFKQKIKELVKHEVETVVP